MIYKILKFNLILALFPLLIFGQKVNFKLIYNPNSCLYEAHAIVIEGNLTFPNTIPFPSKFSIVVPSSINNGVFNVVQNINPPGLNWSNTNNVYSPTAAPGYDFHAFTITGGNSNNAYQNFTEGTDIFLFSFSIPHLNCNDGVRCFLNGSDPASSASGMLGIDFTQSFKTFPNVERFNGISGGNILLPKPSVIADYNINCNYPDSLFLKANSTNFLGCGSIIYQWQGSNGFNSTIQNPRIVTSSTLNYTVTVTDNNGCSSSSSVNYVQPLPITFTGIVNGKDTVCQNESKVIYNIPQITNAISYIWKLPDNTYDTTSLNTISVNYPDLISNAAIRVKGKNLCFESNFSQPLNIIIKPSPVAEAGDNIQICFGDTAMLNAISDSPFSWNNNITNNLSFTPTETKEYILTSLNSSGCITTDTVTITVKHKILKIIAVLEGLFLNDNLMNFTVNDEGNAMWGDSIADIIDIEIRNSVYPFEIIESKTTYLHTNKITYTEIACNNNGAFYIVLKNRNHIETWSSLPVNFSSDTVSYDFTLSASKALGNNLKQISQGIFAIFAGDVNQDGIIDGSDMSQVETDNNNFVSSYVNSDLNGDGIVDGSDMSITEINNNAFIGVVSPY